MKDNMNLLKKNLLKEPKFTFFSGAGTSFYTGMPLGRELSEKFYKEAENDELDMNNWQVTSQEIVDVYDRNKLDRILLEVFNTESIKKTEYHNKLIDNLMLSNIYNLNYDNLFEKNNNGKCRAICREEEINLTTDKEIGIYKLHGDLRNLDKLVITKDDYKEFTEKISKNLLINKFINELSENIVLVCGISFEDEHFFDMFRHINKTLGKNRKKVFYIHPAENENIISMCSELKMLHIKMTFENFVDSIDKILKNNFSKIKDRLEKNKLERKFGEYVVSNGEVDLTQYISNGNIKLEGVETIKEFHKFANRQSRTYKGTIIEQELKFGEFVLEKMKNVKSFMSWNPDYKYEGLIEADDEEIENMKLEFYKLNSEKTLNNVIEVELSTKGVSIIFKIELKNHIEMKQDASYRIDCDWTVVNNSKKDIEYFIAAKKIVKILKAKKIILIYDSNKEIDLDLLLKSTDINPFKDIVNKFEYDLYNIKPIIKKMSSLTLNDFDNVKYSEVNKLLTLIKKQEIIHSNKELKFVELIIKDSIDERMMTSKFPLIIKEEGIVELNNKNINFEREFILNDWEIEVVGDNKVNLKPLSDIIQKNKLLEIK